MLKVSNSKRRLLDMIVPLLSDRQFVSATNLWRKTQKSDGVCSNSCPYYGDEETIQCATCLEGSLRTMSLVTMENKPGELVYWGGAKLLHEWMIEEMGAM